MSAGSGGAALALYGGIGYATFAAIGRVLTDSHGSGPVRIDDGGVPVRLVGAMCLMMFVIGLHDLAQRAETAGHDRRHSSSRASSTAILLGGGIATALLFFAPIAAYEGDTNELATRVIAAAALPLIAVCVGATRALHAGRVAPAPWALLGYVAAAMLLVGGTTSMIQLDVKSTTSGAHGERLIVENREPLIDPLGTLASSLFAVFVLWVLISGILVWRVSRRPDLDW